MVLSASHVSACEPLIVSLCGNKSFDDCCVVDAVAAGCSRILKGHCHGIVSKSDAQYNIYSLHIFDKQ